MTFEVPSNSEDLDNSPNGETFTISNRQSQLTTDTLAMDHFDSTKIYSLLHEGKYHQKKKTISHFIREKTSFQIVSNDLNLQQFASAGPFKCSNDYLVINSLRYCGNYLNEDSLYSTNVQSNAPVVDNSTGPIYIRFVTSVDTASKGFILNFQLNPCLLNG